MRPATAASNIRRNQIAETQKLVIATHAVFDAAGIAWGPSKVSRLVRRYQHQGSGRRAFFDYVANVLQMTARQRQEARADPNVVRVLRYADPTGEKAAHHADNPKVVRYY